MPGVALAVAGCAALVEAATGAGLDNLTLPVAVTLVLSGPV
jgi:dolichol kinase